MAGSAQEKKASKAAATGGFAALTVERTGSFELELAPRDALPLFTAPGEKLWIEDWDPVILHGDGSESGTVFITCNHGATTYWLVSEFDAHTGRARYVRTTPGSDIGTVDVAITANDTGGSTVSVTYRLTGLTAAGNHSLSTAYSASSYASMLRQWRSMIESSCFRLS